MKYLPALSIACLFFALFPAAAHAQSGSPEEGFQAYRRALLNADGGGAWGAVDSGTKRYYDQLLKDAISADRQTVGKMDLMTKMAVVRARVEFTEAQLRVMSGRELFEHAVINGWISRSSVESLPSLVVVSSNERIASLGHPSQPKTGIFTMVKEDGTWRLALWQIFEMANAALKKMATDAGLSEDEFVKELVRRVSRFEFDDTIFDKPRQ